MDIFDAFQHLQVLIVGDVMMDRYLSGRVSRISPEAPVPVVQLLGTEERLGGAANVALNIKAMGATPYLCTVVGADGQGEQLVQMLPQQGLSTVGIVRSKERMTTVKTRVLASNQQLLRVDREDTHGLSAEEAGALLERVREVLDTQQIDVVLFQDYNKGVLTEQTIGGIIALAQARHIPTAVDPKFHNFWAYRGVTLFKPNLKEINAQLPNGLVVDAAGLAAAHEHIRGLLQNDYTMITLSEKGLYIAGRGQQHLLPTHPRDIADVCGAGDTVISVASLALALGLDALSIAALSNLAGGQVCEKVGVVPVDAEQLRREYEAISST